VHEFTPSLSEGRCRHTAPVYFAPAATPTVGARCHPLSFSSPRPPPRLRRCIIRVHSRALTVPYSFRFFTPRPPGGLPSILTYVIFPLKSADPIFHDLRRFPSWCLARLTVQSKIASMRIQRMPDAVPVGGHDTRGRAPCAHPARCRTRGRAPAQAAGLRLPARRAFAFVAPTGGKEVPAQVTRAQVKNACANIESVVW